VQIFGANPAAVDDGQSRFAQQSDVVLEPGAAMAPMETTQQSLSTVTSFPKVDGEHAPAWPEHPAYLAGKALAT
jgi:hypothetical protein